MPLPLPEAPIPTPNRPPFHASTIPTPPLASSLAFLPFLLLYLLLLRTIFLLRLTAVQVIQRFVLSGGTVDHTALQAAMRAGMIDESLVQAVPLAASLVYGGAGAGCQRGHDPDAGGDGGSGGVDVATVKGVAQLIQLLGVTAADGEGELTPEAMGRLKEAIEPFTGGAADHAKLIALIQSTMSGVAYDSSDRLGSSTRLQTLRLSPLPARPRCATAVAVIAAAAAAATAAAGISILGHPPTRSYLHHIFPCGSVQPR